MKAFIRFEGFYNSTLDQIFDSAAERDIEYRQEDNPGIDYEHDLRALSDAAAEYRGKAGKMIFDLLAGELARQGADISFAYAGIDSPREYNFSTDRLAAEYDADALGRFWASCFHECGTVERPEIVDGFAAFVAEELRPCSGFIPFYSDSLESWGVFHCWDEMQHGLLIEFLTRRANSFFNRDFWRCCSDFWHTDGLEYADADYFINALEELACECLPEPVPVAADESEAVPAGGAA